MIGLGCIDTIATMADFLHDKLRDLDRCTITTTISEGTRKGDTQTWPEWEIGNGACGALFGPGVLFGEGDERYQIVGFDFTRVTLWAD